jgi:hypothetical protein
MEYDGVQESAFRSDTVINEVWTSVAQDNGGHIKDQGLPGTITIEAGLGSIHVSKIDFKGAAT